MSPFLARLCEVVLEDSLPLLYSVPSLPFLDTNGVEFHVGRAMARPLIPEILELTAAGTLHPERVTSSVVQWDQAPDAVPEPTTKLVITR